MHGFFSPQLTVSSREITLPPEESRHALQVLRLAPGDCIGLLNGAGVQAEAELTAIDHRRHAGTTCRIVNATCIPRPAPRVTLLLAPPKSKNIDAVIRAATELGTARITPVLCRFGVAKPDQKTIANWTRTVIAAAKQSGNPWFPEITAPMPFPDALRLADRHGFVGAVPQSRDDPTKAMPAAAAEATSLWIGPEGGFAPEELSALYDHGLQPLTVGKWILRVETAVPALLAVVLDRCRTPGHEAKAEGNATV